MNRDRRRTRLLLSLLLLVTFTLITLDSRSGSGSPFGFLRSIGSGVFGPLEKGASAIARPVGNALSDLGHVGRDRSKVRKLQTQIATLQNQVHEDTLSLTRQRELSKLYALTQRGRYTVVAAHVVATGPGLGFEWTVAIDRGSADGVRKDDTVLNGDGLVGRVERVGRTTSTVLLLVDKESTVFARLAGSLEQGEVNGEGLAPLRLTLLDQNAALTVGQQLVSLGSVHDRPYVPEVPIGVVRRVLATPGALTRSAIVLPYVDFSALDIVGVVIKPPPRVAHDAVLPPSPTPSPSSSPSPQGSPSPGASGSPSPSPTPSGG
jgi:rod shape-determining protein MreC